MTQVFDSIYTHLKWAYPTYSKKQLYNFSKRLAGARCAWRNIALITNEMGGPFSHYKNQNAMIRDIMRIKGCEAPASNDLEEPDATDEESLLSGDSESSGGGSSGSSSSDSNDSSADQADNEDLTFDDVLHSIASAIDAHYYIVNDTVYFVSFNTLFAGGYKETGFPDKPIVIDYWMQEDGSLDVDVNQAGMINTVVLHYKNGTVKVCNEDLVNIYGEVSATYSDKTLSYTQARVKAEAYLSANIRDFNMTVQVSALYSGKLAVGQYIKLRNPLTMTENLYYIYGLSVNWNAGEKTFVADLDLRYGPENPDNPEVPETGGGYYTNNSGSSGGGGGGQMAGNPSGTVADFAKKIVGNATTNDEKVQKIWAWWKSNMHYGHYECSRQSTEQVLSSKEANCTDTAKALCDLFTAVGVPNKLHHCFSVTFTTGHRAGHYYPEAKYGNGWVIVDGVSRYAGWGGKNMVSKSNCKELSSVSEVC